MKDYNSAKNSFLVWVIFKEIVLKVSLQNYQH